MDVDAVVNRLEGEHCALCFPEHRGVIQDNFRDIKQRRRDGRPRAGSYCRVYSIFRER